MIGHVLTCVWLISHFVALFSPCFICTSLFSHTNMESTNMKGVDVWEMLSGRCKGGFTGFLRSVFSRLWFRYTKECGECVFISAANVVLTDVYLLEQIIVISHHWGENFVLGCGKFLSKSIHFSMCPTFFEIYAHLQTTSRIMESDSMQCVICTFPTSSSLFTL